MGENGNIKINRLPAITWYWLNMNEASVGTKFSGAAVADAEVPEGIQTRESEKNLFPEQPTGAGKAFTEAVEASARGVQVYTAPAGRKADAPLRLKYFYQDGDRSVNAVNLVAEKNSELTVVMDYTAAPDASGAAAVQTKFSAGENSVLRLVQIVRVGQNFSFIKPPNR